MRAGIAVSWFVGVSLVAAGIVHGEEAGHYLPPENFAALNLPNEYLPQATAFLKAHPQDPRAPHVAFDLLMVATVRNDQEAIRAAQLRLLLDYAHSLPTEFFLKSTPAPTIAEALKKHFCDVRPLDQQALQRFNRAVEQCIRVLGVEFGDDELKAQQALAVQDPDAALDIINRIADREGLPARAVAIAYDKELAAAEKYTALQALHKNKTAQAYQRFLYESMLDDAERALPAVQLVAIENLLREQKFAAALPLLTNLRTTANEPRIMYWQGWAQAAQGETAAAQRTLGELSREFPDSPYVKLASDLQQTVAALEQSLEEQADCLDKTFVGLLIAPPEVLAADFTLQLENLPLFEVYVGMDFKDDAVAISGVADGQHRLVYSADNNDVRIHLPGDPTIRSFASGGMCPLITGKIQQDQNGKHHFSIWANSVSQGSGEMRRSLRDALAMPALAMPQKRRELMRHFIRGGTFPRAVERHDGKLVLTWISPVVDEPKFHTFRFDLSEKYKLEAIVAEWWSLKNVRYGQRRSTPLVPLAWPDLPVEKQEQFGPSEFVRLMGLVASLGDKKQTSPPQVATEPQPAAAPRR